MTKFLLVGFVRLYQLTLSPAWRLLPFAPPVCRFEPTCSEYARQAIGLHGAARGCALAARRLARCHPFCCGGHDPVPPQ